MKKIPLRDRNKNIIAYTLMDDEDYEMAKHFKWFAHPRRGKFYASTNLYFPETQTQTTVSLHHAILWTPKGLVVDHLNGKTFDNRKANLRICTQTENNQNSKKRKDNSSGIRGVHHREGKWIARIGYKNERFFLGSFSTKEEAGEAYNRKAKELYGIHAKLN